MRESRIEQRLRTGIHRMGGLCYKFTSPGRRNVPDRLIVLPGIPAYFVETKAPGKDLRAGQQREAARLAARGMLVFKLDSIELVDEHLTRRHRQLTAGKAHS